MQTPDGEWRIEVYRKPGTRAYWYRLRHGDNVVESLTIAEVRRLIEEAGYRWATSSTPQPDEPAFPDRVQVVATSDSNRDSNRPGRERPGRDRDGQWSEATNVGGQSRTARPELTSEGSMLATPLWLWLARRRRAPPISRSCARGLSRWRRGSAPGRRSP
jgi:hypothetical protein